VLDTTTAITILGGNRLITDIIRGVIGSVADDGRPLTVLIDPELEHWREARDQAIVCVLSNPTDQQIVHAIRRGADAVVDADAVVAELAAAVAVVRAGGVSLQRRHMRLVVDALRRDGQVERISLTRREDDIVRSIIAGDSVKQTALRLGIAHKTVENLQRRMFRKLDVRNRAQAVARVHELGLLEDVDPGGTEGFASATRGGVNP
jgi:DNA-binding NarL/FixJ family response regulator